MDLAQSQASLEICCELPGESLIKNKNSLRGKFASLASLSSVWYAALKMHLAVSLL